MICLLRNLARVGQRVDRCLWSTKARGIQLSSSLRSDGKKDQNSTSEKKEPPKPGWTAPSVGKVLKIKDLFDYIIYGVFGLAIYYAYKNYKKTSEFKREIEANVVPMVHFKHKFYEIKGCHLPDVIVKKLQTLKAFETRREDVWVASFPKSGTTWLQEMIFLIENDCDFAKAKAKSIEERSPFFEYPVPGLKYINSMSSPRVIKTHLPIELLPDDVENKSKVVYILRNPKDVVVSFYHFLKMNLEVGFSGGLEDLIQAFIQGKVPYGPWWKHVDGYTSRKNVHIMVYEDLLKDPKGELKALCKFLGKELSDEQMEAVVKWCSFDNMKSNPAVNYEWNKELGLFKKDGDFFRKGKVGDWLNHFEPRVSLQFDKAIEGNLVYKRQLDYGISDEDLVRIYDFSKAPQNEKVAIK